MRAVSTSLHLDDTNWGLCCRFVLNSQPGFTVLFSISSSRKVLELIVKPVQYIKRASQPDIGGIPSITQFFFNFVRFFSFFSKVHVSEFTSYSGTTVCLQKHFCQLKMPGTFLKWENCSFSSSHVEYPHHLTLPDYGLSGTLRVNCC